MKEILMCTIDPMLLKTVSGIVRQEGFRIEAVDHAAFAVQKVFERTFAAVIIDSQGLGLPADDAARMIAQESRDIPIILIGGAVVDVAATVLDYPLDPAELRQAIRMLVGTQTRERSVAGL